MNDEEMKLKYKLCEFGVYGEQVNSFNEEELEKLIFLPCVEILTREQYEKLKSDFEQTNFIKQKEKIILNLNITKKNVKSHNLLVVLDQYYLRVELNTWRQIVMNGDHRFRRFEFFLLLNDLLKTKEFIPFHFLKNKWGLPRRSWTVFYEFLLRHNMIERFYNNKSLEIRLKKPSEREIINPMVDCSDNLEEENLEDKKAIVTNRSDILYKVPFYNQVRDVILNSDKGITTNDISEMYSLNLKIALKVLQKVAKFDKNISFYDFSEGKVTMLKFLSKQVVEDILKKTKKSDSEKISILRLDKIEAIRQMYVAKGPFAITPAIKLEFSERIESKFIPDTKNLIKLVKEAGLNVISVNIGGYGDRFHYIVTSVDLKPDDPLILNLAKSSKQCRFLNFKKATEAFFVNYANYIAVDNGFIVDKKERTKKFIDLIRMHAKDGKTLFNDELIGKLTLFEVFNFIKYPHFFVEKVSHAEKEDEISLIEVKEMPDDNYFRQLSKLKVNDILIKRYANFEYTILSKTVTSQAFSKYLQSLSSNNILNIENAGEGYTISINEGVNLDNNKYIRASSTLKYVTFADRLEFYRKIMNFDRLNFMEKAKDLIKTEYTGDIFFALSERLEHFGNTCFQEFAKKKRPPITDGVPKAYFDICYDIKKQIIMQKVKYVQQIKNHSIADSQEVIKTLKRKGLLKSKKNKDRISIIYKFKNIIENCNLESVIPKEYIYGKHLDVIQRMDGFDLLVVNVILYFIMKDGTMKFNQLKREVFFLSQEEFNNFLTKYNSIFKIKSYSGISYVSLILHRDNTNMKKTVLP